MLKNLALIISAIVFFSGILATASAVPASPDHLKFARGQNSPPLQVIDPTENREFNFEKQFVSGGTPSKKQPAPALGEQKALVILINFADKPNAEIYTPSYFNGFVFNDSENASSLNNFYKEVSYGKVNIAGEVAGEKWYTSSRENSWYSSDVTDLDENITDADPANWHVIWDLAREAIQLADNDTDYSQYDSDGDNIIDKLIIVHAGNGQESSFVGSDIWSHKWTIYTWNGSVFNSGYVTNDGVVAMDYAMVAESSPIGTLTHEVGHLFGLPDLYNSGGSVVGTWDLMDFGSWTGSPPGSNPSHFSAWSKLQLGWVDPLIVNKSSDEIISLPPVEIAALNSVIKIIINPAEYFLVENRQRNVSIYDNGISEDGILIWHIDETKFDNSGTTKMVLLEDENESTLSLDDAAFQVSQNFDPSTIPNSNDNSGGTTDISVSPLVFSNKNFVTAINNADQIAPIISVTSPENITYNSSTIQAAISLSDTAVSCQYSLDNSTPGIMLPDLTEEGKWSANLEDLSDGPHSIFFNCTDSLETSGSPQIFFSVDANPPQLSSQSRSPSDEINQGENVIFESIWSDINNISVFFESNFTGEMQLHKTNNANETYKFTINGGNLLEGQTISWRFVANDTAGNFNNETPTESFEVKEEIDILPPQIFDMHASSAKVKQNSEFVFSAKVNDSNEIDEVFISGYNSSGEKVFSDKPLTNEGTFWFTNFAVGDVSDGTYTFNITASDTLGNSQTIHAFDLIVNGTNGAEEILNFGPTLNFDDETIETDEPINTTLEIVTSETVEKGLLTVSTYSSNPGTANFGISGINKFIEINPSSELSGNLSWALIKIFYNDSDIPIGQIEENLRISFNENGVWTVFNSPNGGVNTTENYVWANTTHFTIFGAFFLATCSDGIQNQGETGVDSGGPCGGGTPAPTTSSGGGGGGGGGGGRRTTTVTNTQNNQSNVTTPTVPRPLPKPTETTETNQTGVQETANKTATNPLTGLVTGLQSGNYTWIIVTVLLAAAGAAVFMKIQSKKKFHRKLDLWPY